LGCQRDWLGVSNVNFSTNGCVTAGEVPRNERRTASFYTRGTDAWFESNGPWPADGAEARDRSKSLILRRSRLGKLAWAKKFRDQGVPVNITRCGRFDVETTLSSFVAVASDSFLFRNGGIPR
jgi:hypothetical protein